MFKYAIVGAIGAAITSYTNFIFENLGVPEYIYPLGDRIPVPWSLGFAIIIAFISNYILNSIWTFKT